MSAFRPQSCRSLRSHLQSDENKIIRGEIDSFRLVFMADMLIIFAVFHFNRNLSEEVDSWKWGLSALETWGVEWLPT